MGRLSTSYKNALSKASRRVCYLVKVEAVEDTLLATTHTRDVTYDGDTYLSIGNIIKELSTVEENYDIRSQEFTLAIIANPEAINFARNYYYEGKPITVYEQPLDQNFVPEGEPTVYWAGLIDQLTTVFDGSQYNVIVKGQNEFIRWDYPAYFVYSPEHQKETYPDDKFYDLTASITGLEIRWGGPGLERQLTVTDRLLSEQNVPPGADRR